MNARIIPGILLLLLTTGYATVCQQLPGDTALLQQLVTRIYFHQQHHEKDFPAGMVPSYRVYRHNPGVAKNDDNIFFTGLVIYTLRNAYPYLDKTSQQICDSIFTRAVTVYPRFQNKKGRPTYNFWRTDQPEIFPNGGWLNLFNKSQALPDDLDDTAILLLALESADSTVEQVYGLMQGFTNNNLKKVKNGLAAYKNIPAYSTWFGKKMPVDIDFCVLTNILLMVDKYQLNYTAADSASLEYIVKVVENRHYMSAASRVSPHYNRTPVLLYHLSRLMAEKKISSLEKFKPQLISDATECYNSSGNFMDKIILSTALLRWDVVLPADTISINAGLQNFVENYDFVFFIANITSILPQPFNALLGKTGIGKFYYYSPAWNLALVVENMIWRKRVADRVRL